jgi:SAM-dependent methyltransferase
LIMDRRSALLADLNIATARGLEIGPLTAAVVSKADGKVEYIDHLSTEELKKKYANETGIDTDKIPTIDHVLEEGKLPRHLIGGNYDYIIASHVFEHLPNPLGWLRDCAAILRSGGCLALVIPDKRFTFDLTRSLTTLAELIESDLLDQRRPGLRQIYDAATCSARIEAGITWSRPPRQEELAPTGADVDAFGLLKAEEGRDDYLDIHCTVYTPTSLLHLLARTARLDKHPFRLKSFHDTPFNSIEFYLQLVNASEQSPQERETSFLDALKNCVESSEPWQSESNAPSKQTTTSLLRPGSRLRRGIGKIRSFAARATSGSPSKLSSQDAAFSADQQASGEHWDRVLAKGNSGLRLHWWEDPSTLRHINQLVCGEPLEGLHTGFHQKILEKLSTNPTTIRALSVGCGTGAKEIELIKAAAGKLQFDFQCFDVAPAAIEAAKTLAREQGVENQITFSLADAFRLTLDNNWDLVYWNNSLHHMLDTDVAIEWSHDRLRKGGLLAMDDYVGPDRFQWTDATIQRATGLLQSLTAQQRTDPCQPRRTVREVGGRPPIDAVIATDPTEAADSSRIRPALNRLFPSSLEWIPTGGLTYLICLDELFENFRSVDELKQLQDLLDIDAEWARTVETAYAVALAIK